MVVWETSSVMMMTALRFRRITPSLIQLRGRFMERDATILQEIDDKDDCKAERRENLYYPFMSLQDFEMGAWLSQSNASMSQIDAFLKLSYVCLLSSALPLYC